MFACGRKWEERSKRKKNIRSDRQDYMLMLDEPVENIYRAKTLNSFKFKSKNYLRSCKVILIKSFTD